MRETKNIIVVGGNAAGPSAAAKAKRTAPNANVLLFEAGDFISTGTCELPYVLSGEIEDYRNIVFYDPDSYEKEKGVKVYTRHFVESINRKQKSITVKNLNDNSKIEIPYDKLILTTGSKINKISNLGDSLKNVFYLKSVKDYLGIKTFISSNQYKNVLIIGAGYIGLECAEAFRNLRSDVRIFEKSKLPLPGASDETSNLILEELKKNGVNFYGNVDSPKFIIENNFVKAANFQSRIIEFDLVLVATGVKPNNSLAVSSRLDVGKFGGIKVDNRLKTSDQNIFAAGDNIEIVNRISRKNEYLPLATFAHKHGHIAGANAAGANEICEPFIKNIAVKIFNNAYVGVGLNEIQAQEIGSNYLKVTAVSNNLVKVMPNSRKTFGQIIYEKNSGLILGAEFFGGKETIGYGDLISSMIYNKSKAVTLGAMDFNYTPPYSPFINLLSILGRKIKKG